MQRPSDRKVIKKIKEGNIDYFEYIVKEYTKKVYVFVSRKLFDKSETEDIVQNSFLKFYKAISKFDENRPILPYLFEIAKNEVRMYIRSKKSTVSLDDALEIPAMEEVQLFQEEGVGKLLNVLSSEQKEALILLSEGYSYREIAKKTKKPINTIRTIIRRGRLKLAKLKKS